MDVKYIGGDEPWTLPFGDHFYSPSQTSMVSSHVDDEDLQTIARRYDFQALSALESGSSQKKSPSVDPKSRWMNAGVFFTDQTIQADYPPVLPTEYRDDHGHTFCYLCSINAHEHPRTQPRPTSQRRKLIPYNNPKALKARPASADRVRPPPPTDNLIPYRFIVRTDPQPNSGTRAQVYLYMYGTENNWTSIHLRSSSQNSSIDGFPSGSVRTFCFKGPDIGVLNHLNVNLVGARSDQEWFLKEIEITNLKTSVTWLCEFHCWLPKKDKEESQVKPTVERPRPISVENLVVYVLQVYTGGKAFAGTDANITVRIRGTTSETRTLALTSNQSDLFEQNQLDTFTIVGWDLGDLTEMNVTSDNSQMASDWDLKEMLVWKMFPAANAIPVYFPFNQWLGAKTKRLKAKAEPYVGREDRNRGPICYFISIKTGNRMNAGTDANVYIQIYGSSGRSTIHHLDNAGKNDFESGSTSNFAIMDSDVGHIESLRIWHDNSGPGAGWYLETITIRKKYSLSRVVAENFIQRLKRFTELFYDQAKERIEKDQSQRRREDREFSDRLGSSRGILRSSMENERGSGQKKVSWETKKSIDSRTGREINDDPILIRSGRFEHKVTWISSHRFVNNKWEIKSLEEEDRHSLDPSTRKSLLADRSSAIYSKKKITDMDPDDETFEFEANRWLAVDEGDRKVEVTLKPKSHRSSSHTKFDDQFDQKKRPTSRTDLKPIEGSPRSASTREKKHTSSEPTLRSRSPLDPPPFQHSTRGRLYSSAYGILPE